MFDQRFDRVETEVHELRSDMKDEFRAARAEMNDMRGEMKDGLERVNDRIDSVQRAIFFGAISLTGAILAGFAGIFALLAATL